MVFGQDLRADADRGLLSRREITKKSGEVGSPGKRDATERSSSHWRLENTLSHQDNLLTPTDRPGGLGT